jgi:hypothetical protein
MGSPVTGSATAGCALRVSGILQWLEHTDRGPSGPRQAYLDGELCGVRLDGTASFSPIQTASDAGDDGALVFFLFDLLHLDGDDIGPEAAVGAQGAPSRPAVGCEPAAQIVIAQI